MEYIAFKAHKTRGPEIIKILESWGGVNIKGLDATCETHESVKIVYYVTHYNTIGYNPLSLVKSLGYKIYTLEEYEAMNKEKKYQEGYAQGYEDAVKTEIMYKEKEKQELLLGLVSVANKGQELIPHKDYEIKQDGEKFYLVKKEPRLSIKSVKKVYVCETEKARIHLEFYEDDDKACILTNLFVHSAFRHQGIGRKTVAEAEAIAKELGATKALLMVECDDWKRPWYESMGYKYHSTEDEDDVWLVKDL